MTGPEHYREAERLLTRFNEVSENPRSFAKAASVIEPFLTAAQVHATLALAAATVAPHADIDWQRVILP